MVFAKYVELDFQEVTQRKCMTVATKAAVRDCLEESNPAQIAGNAGTIISREYCLLPCDLRQLDQVRGAGWKG